MLIHYRMHFTQLNSGGHSSPTQTASTYDAAPRSDLGDQSNFDLRNGSGYIGGDFRPSYSVEPEEQESRGSISSLAKRNESDFLDYNFLQGRVADAHDDIERNISQEQAGFSSSSVTLDEKRETPEPISTSQEQAQCSSPSVTWDEKRETLEATRQDSDYDGMAQEDNHNRPLESFSPNLDLETFSGEGPDFGTRDEMVVQPCNQGVQDPESGDVHLDDIESEADSFMDALNTIESESEIDIDCRKKQEAEYHPKLEEKGVDGVFEPIRHNSESRSSSSESNVVAKSPLLNGSCEPAPISMTRKSPNTIYCFINEAEVEDECNSVSQSSPQGTDSHENGNTGAGNQVKSISSAIPSNFRGDSPGISITDGTRSIPDAYKQAPETSNATPVTFWTNGGLLGLQPSKPPDFNVLNALPQDPQCKKDGKIGSCNQNFTLTNEDSGKQDQWENFKNVEEGIDSSNSHEYQESGASYRKTSWKISPADLDINLGKLVTSLNQNNVNSTGSNARLSGGASQADGKHQENTRSSSQMFDLSSRLLSTRSDKTLLPGGDGNTYPAGYKNANAFEQKNRPGVGYPAFSGQSKDLFGGESPILSPPSSPPLQHMKISFQPIDGFESSKLKLKFPDRNTNNESGIDIFPSFQLVPEVSISRYNVGLDSDADTFYRSSPSLSDDCHSNQSESNSEQWESSGSPTKDHDLYDALRRISITESVSTLPENGRTNHEDNHDKFGLQFLDNGGKNLESRSSFDLQSLGSINHSFRKELRNDANSKDLVESQRAPASVPPPLPPVQWRGSTPHLDFMEDMGSAMTEGSYYAADITRSASTVSQPKPAPFNEDQIYPTNVQKSKVILNLLLFPQLFVLWGFHLVTYIQTIYVLSSPSHTSQMDRGKLTRERA